MSAPQLVGLSLDFFLAFEQPSTTSSGLARNHRLTLVRVLIRSKRLLDWLDLWPVVVSMAPERIRVEKDIKRVVGDDCHPS